MIHDDVQLLIAPYVLGTASESEQRMVERHAMKCDECRVHITDFEQVSLGLAYSAVSEAPRAELRSRVLDAVSSAAHEQNEADAPATKQVHAAATRGSHWRERVMRWVFVPAVPALAAGCLVLGVLWINAKDDLSAAKSTTPMKSEVVSTNAVASLQTTGLLSGASGSIVTSGNHGYVLLKDMPTPPKGKAWQAWIVRSDVDAPKVSLGVMHDSVQVTVLPLSTIDGDSSGTFAVTLEPTAGSKQPTTTPIVVAGYSLA